MSEFIETPRLFLRQATEAEMRQMIAEAPDAEMKKAYGEMLDGALAHPDEAAFFLAWLAFKKENPSCRVGDLCFKGLCPDGSVEIGYGIEESEQGKGYATEAAGALVDWALAKPFVTAVEAETEPNNLASRRVLGKLGFVPTGEMGEEGPRFRKSAFS